MKKYIVALLLLCCMHVESQEAPSGIFISPFDFPLFLSANFGELRSNHFHGGLDFKTQNVEGKAIHCIADGYVSRVTISSGGFGKVIYVDHPDGYTSLYGHVKAFSPEVSHSVERFQYEHETFEADITFDSTRFPVKQGDVIALSGNEGYSFGPHLHLEIRKTKNGERINPLPFYRNKIKDNIPPRASSIMIYPRSGKGIINGSITKQSFPVSTVTPGRCIQKTVEAWGEVGLGIKAFDYMSGTSNNYGVYSVTLYVDGQEIFNSKIDSYLPDENRMINSCTDFNEFRCNNSWFMKSFIESGNTFSGLKAKNNGFIKIDQEKEYEVKYVLSDFYGNTSVYGFVLKGKKQNIPALKNNNTRHYLSWNKTNVIQEPGLELIIPKGMVYEDVALNISVRNDSNAISYEYQLHDEEFPLHAGCNLIIGIRNMPVKDTTKYYVARKAGKARYYAGGNYENKWMKTSIRELGTYIVAIDTIPPKVTPIGKTAWGKNGTINYKISDGQTGINTYKGKIDGKFALFSFNAKTSYLTCRLDPRYVQKGRKHTLELIVTDNCGNEQISKELFIW